MKQTSFTAHDQDDQPVLTGKPITDFSGIRFTIPTADEQVGINYGKPASTSLGELLKLKGLNVPIRIIPGFERLIAIPFQKILIVRLTKDDGKSSDLLKENTFTTLRFKPVNSPPISLRVRVVRVCEYPNPTDEYRNENGNATPTNTVLIEWDKSSEKNKLNVAFGTFLLNEHGIILSSQTENLVLQSDEAVDDNNKPGPPIRDDRTPDGFSVKGSDFETSPPDGTMTSDAPIVAVLDTGIKTRFDADGSVTNQYPDSSQPLQMRKLRLALATVTHKWGYGPITEYLRASSESDPVLDKRYKDIPTLTRLHTMKRAEILSSPFDDHRLINGNEVRGRHGTTISAIINQKSKAAVLPVKIFNQGGFGTLYDLLCGLNYVLACKKKGLPVRVINLSFASQLHDDSYQLLRSKFKALHNAGIWAVAAAGNSHRELKVNVTPTSPSFDPSAMTTNTVVWNLFPACFAGDPDLSVLTVTTVRAHHFRLIQQPPRKAALVWPLTEDILSEILNVFHLPTNLTLVPVYKTARNYGLSFVKVGVIEPLKKVFQNADPHLNTTSFATAFFSAKLADYLNLHPAYNRQELLAGLTFRGEMVSDDEIDDNRLIYYQ